MFTHFEHERVGGDKGIDIVFDPVGGSYAEIGVRAMAWKGRFLVIGFAAGDIPKIPLNLPLLKGCDIRGVFWGAHMKREPAQGRAALEKLMRWAAEGKISSHVDSTFPLAQAQTIRNAQQSRAELNKV